MKDVQTILAGVDSDAEVFVLDPSRTGIAQITEILAGRTDVRELHIFSEGKNGAIKKAGQSIDGSNVTSYQSALAQPGHVLADGADILLYR